jgi:helix-turn-helix protein
MTESTRESLPVLLSAEDIQHHVRCSRTEAYELMAKQLPTVRIGRLLRVERDAFLTFIQDRRIPA